jgi:hypothetical protein
LSPWVEIPEPPKQAGRGREVFPQIGSPSLKWSYYQVPVAHAYILATQEAEIRRIEVQSQPRANSL